MTNWKYKNKIIKTINDIPNDKYNSVYQITFSNGDFYIGSKAVYTTRKTKLSKKKSLNLWKGIGPKPKFEYVTKDNGFFKYKSSSNIVKERLSNNEKATFVILDFYSTKMEMLLQEAYLIIKYILERNNKLLNQWVSIKSFKLK